MRNWKAGFLALVWIAGATAGGAAATELRADMRRATPSGPGEAVGTVTIADSAQGAVIKTDLKGLPPGPHGFHVHEHSSCEPGATNSHPVPAGAAGGHFDPRTYRQARRPAGRRSSRRSAGPASRR